MGVAISASLLGRCRQLGDFHSLWRTYRPGGTSAMRNSKAGITLGDTGEPFAVIPSQKQVQLGQFSVIDEPALDLSM
jgi:hypothetical protein